MGSFHGRRKPSAKKASKPKGDSAEDIAARQARDQFIKDMAAKAASVASAEQSDTGGIHPSRLARADPFTGGRPNNNFSQHRQEEKPARGMRAPDLRQKNNKRTFEDALQSGSTETMSHKPTKKQRTLEEIRKLKGPAAMKKEEEKRRRQAEAAKAPKESSPSDSIPKAAPEASNSDDDQTPIPSKKGKRSIKEDVSTKKTPEEKLQRKLDKAARKAAKKQGAESDRPESEPTEPVSVADEAVETKEAKKARKRAERAAKQVLENDDDATAPEVEQETKEQRKERKRLAKLAAAEMPGSDDRASKKAAKKAKHAPDVSADSEEVKKQVQDPILNGWSNAAASLGPKSSKFMKLLGGAKAGAISESAAPAGSTAADSRVTTARKAERDLQKQYEAGMQAKQAGLRRSGLGA